MTDMDRLMPHIVAQLPPLIAVSRDMQSTTVKTMYSTFSDLLDQIGRMTDTASAMGQAFDDAKSDDGLYLPPDAFSSKGFPTSLEVDDLSGWHIGAVHHHS